MLLVLVAFEILDGENAFDFEAAELNSITGADCLKVVTILDVRRMGESFFEAALSIVGTDDDSELMAEARKALGGAVKYFNTFAR